MSNTGRGTNCPSCNGAIDAAALAALQQIAAALQACCPGGGGGGITTVITGSGIQGDGSAASPVRPNFDVLPQEATLPAGAQLIVTTPTNPDGALVTPASLINQAMCNGIAAGATPSGGTNVTHPDNYFGLDNQRYLSTPYGWVRLACTTSPTGFIAVPAYVVA